MKIFGGVYHGCEIEFGIVSGTSGQCYLNIRFSADELHPIIDQISDEKIRGIFNFPAETRDGEFSVELSTKTYTLSSWFMFSCVSKCTQFEYMAYIFRSIDQLIKCNPNPIVK